MDGRKEEEEVKEEETFFFWGTRITKVWLQRMWQQQVWVQQVCRQQVWAQLPITVTLVSHPPLGWKTTWVAVVT